MPITINTTERTENFYKQLWPQLLDMFRGFELILLGLNEAGDEGVTVPFTDFTNIGAFDVADGSTASVIIKSHNGDETPQVYVVGFDTEGKNVLRILYNVRPRD